MFFFLLRLKVKKCCARFSDKSDWTWANLVSFVQKMTEGMTCSHGISNANTVPYVSPFFSCWIMVAPIRQRCVIAWVRHTNSFLFVCLCQSAWHTAEHRTGLSASPNSKVLIIFIQCSLCVSVIVCLCAHFMPISYLLIFLSHYLSICLQSITALLPWLPFRINHAEGCWAINLHTVQWGISPILIDYILMVY